MEYFIANWKSHKTEKEVITWFDHLQGITPSGEVEVVVCPAFVHLSLAKSLMSQKNIPWSLGSQDISAFPFGKYTGAIAAEMSAEYGQYAIVGHSERRQYFHETNQDVVNKVDQCLASGLTPIVCVDEPYTKSQLLAIPKENYSRLIIAYEPLAAIGSGVPDSVAHAGEVMAMIWDLVDKRCPLLYGGSATAGNARDFWQIESMAGFLVGNTSLDATKWQALVAVGRHR